MELSTVSGASVMTWQVCFAVLALLANVAAVFAFQAQEKTSASLRSFNVVQPVFPEGGMSEVFVAAMARYKE